MFYTVNLCSPSASRIKFQFIFSLDKKKCHPQLQLRSCIINVLLNGVSLAYLLYFTALKSPLTLCEHFPLSLTKETSIWLVLVFSSHLFLVLITPSHTALWVLVVMYYCTVSFTVNKRLCKGKYHINVTELYLFGVFFLHWLTSDPALLFCKCPAPFTPTVRRNCASEGKRQSLKHAKKSLWLYF